MRFVRGCVRGAFARSSLEEGEQWGQHTIRAVSCVLIYVFHTHIRVASKSEPLHTTPLLCMLVHKSCDSARLLLSFFTTRAYGSTTNLMHDTYCTYRTEKANRSRVCVLVLEIRTYYSLGCEVQIPMQTRGDVRADYRIMFFLVESC